MLFLNEITKTFKSSLQKCKSAKPKVQKKFLEKQLPIFLHNS